MVRRTKSEALATRNALLDAAELQFQAKGVSATSLNDIAVAAGTTRGAIYWHFHDKADLFNAMMERVCLPMEDTLNAPQCSTNNDPLPAMRSGILQALERTVTDPQTRRVFEVATHKVEYVDSLCAVRQRHLQVRDTWLMHIQQTLERCAQLRGGQLPISAEMAARGLHALFDGLIQNWLLDTSSFDLRVCGQQALDAYLSGLGLGVPVTEAS